RELKWIAPSRFYDRGERRRGRAAMWPLLPPSWGRPLAIRARSRASRLRSPNFVWPCSMPMSSFMSTDNFVISRREMLRHAGCGFGAWALLDLATREGLLHAAPAAALENPLAPKRPHFSARARH